MKTRILHTIFILTVIALGNSAAQNPVQQYGQLRVDGNRIVDKKGKPVQLKGMSLFWSQWMGKYYQADAVKWLVKDWNIEVIRVAMAVDNGGYASQPEEEMRKVRLVVDEAIRQGIYVILDFHVHDASPYLTQSIQFFTDISRQYGHLPNLIYEPWNEPVKHDWSTEIKPYHEKVVAAIRQHDPDNLIVLGTRTWSQDVDEAAANPVSGSNLVYTLHYYAATHKASLRAKAENALSRGVALMVTEYGTCEASGDGLVDVAESRLWWDFLDANFISHCNWAVSDKKESASALVPGASAQGQWSLDHLTESGRLVREEILKNKKQKTSDSRRRKTKQ